jgi:hypothetical protein
VLAKCEESAISVSMLDPATAAEEQIGEFTLVGTPLFGCVRLRDYPSLQLQTLFDPSFSRLAISLEGEGDGSSHVGWQHADGSVVDVTALAAEDSGVPAGDARHSNAMFGSDGSFQFLDDAANELVSYAVSADGQLADTATRTDVGGSTRSALATPWGDPWLGFVGGDPGSSCRNLPGPSGLFAASGAESSPQIWLDDEAFLQVEQTGTTLSFAVGGTIPEGYQGFCPSPGIPLHTASEGELLSPVQSPDTTQVAFLTRAGSELSLSVLPMAGGAATEIGAIEGSASAAFLVAWRA